MKTVFFYTLKCSVVAFLLAFTTPAFTQDKDTSLHVNEWVDARRFVFTAQTATPQTGGFVQLTSLYGIRISADTILSSLPYYGRAYVAPMNPQDAGLQFTATGFVYESKKAGDDKWEVTIATKDLRDNYKLFFYHLHKRSGTATGYQQQPPTDSF